MTSLADQLIDAQVSYVLDQLGGTELEQTLADAVDDVLAIGASLQLAEVLDPDHVKAVVRRLLASVPASTGASEIVDIATEVVYAGPATPFALGELVVREQVEALLDEILGLAPLAERALDQLTDSPLVGMVASRFMGRIVGEVLAANKAVADKVPGLGSLVSFGTSAASKVKGVADKQFDALLGDTAGKGAAFAVRRLNKIIIDTVQDPATRDAVLQVWDLAAEEPVGGLGRYVDRDAVTRIVYAAQSVVATAAGTEHAAALVDAFVDGFFSRYGGLPITTLLDELEVDRDTLVADLRAAAPRAVEAARASGELERIIRARVEPFYRSPAVVALLG